MRLLRVLEFRVREAAEVCTKSITVGTPARATSAASWSGPEGSRYEVPATSFTASSRGRRACRRTGSARSTRSSPTRPRSAPRPRSARSPPAPLRASARRVAFRSRWSSSCSAVSTTEVTIPGLQETFPRYTLRRRPSVVRSRGSRARASLRPRARPCVRPSASTACAAWPRQVILCRSTPNVPRTTPRGRPSDSSRFPLDVQLEVGGSRVELRVRVERAVEVHVVLGQCVRQACAVRVDELPQLVLVGHRAGRGARAEEAAAEARALLVRPVHEPDCDGRRSLLDDPAQDLDARDDAERAVEPAAVRHRVDVAPEEDRALRPACEREPLVAGRVDRLLRSGLGDLVAKPGARLLPGLGPRDALCAVLVARAPSAPSARRRFAWSSGTAKPVPSRRRAPGDILPCAGSRGGGVAPFARTGWSEVGDEEPGDRRSSAARCEIGDRPGLRDPRKEVR